VTKLVVWLTIVGAILIAGADAGPAARPPWTDPPIVSPDGRRTAILLHDGGWGHLLVGEKGGEQRSLYASSDSCCNGIVWASPRLIVFVDDYNVKTLNVWTGRVRRIAGFSNFVVSRDGKLVAGWQDHGGHGATEVGVVAITGGTCLHVPKPENADDTQPVFSRNGKRLSVMRRAFDPSGGRVDPSSGRRVVVPLSALRTGRTYGC
jgi:hypothetical protein